GRGHADGGQGLSGAEHGQTCGGRDGFQVGQSGASGVKPGRVEHGTGNEGGTVVTGQRQAIDQGGARGRAVDPEHGPHCCRLARAVRPQKPSDDAIGNRERDVVDRRDPAIALGQMLDLDHAQPSLFDSASPAAANIRSSSGRMAITTPATTSIPNASPERTSWASWTPASTRETAMPTAIGTATQPARVRTLMQAVAKAAASTAWFEGHDQSPAAGHAITVARSAAVHGRGSATRTLIPSLSA